MTLTGRTALAAVAGAVVVLAFGSMTALLVVNAAILAGIAADLVLAASPARLRVSRSGDRRVHLAESGSVTLTIVNEGRRALRGVVRDGWLPSAGSRPARARVALAPGAAAQVVTSLTPRRRGDLAGGPVTVRCYGPLGLAARQRELTAPWTVRVLPRFLSRRHLPEKLARLRDLDGRQPSLLRGQGSEFDSLRAYVLGDDVRSVDWRSTARRGDVLVRTWRPERGRQIVIVLDTGRTSAGRVGDIPRLDAAMDAVLLLAALAVRAGDRVDLIAADRRVRTRVTGVDRGDLLVTLTAELAMIEPDLVESSVEVLAAAVLATARQRCLVVLMTDLDPAAIDQGLLPRLPLLTARHQVVVAAVADPRVAEMAGGRDSARAVYQAAAAARAGGRRAQARALLRGYGVEVVDAPPDRLPAALADRYLDLKAAGRL
ncbi:MAG: DUF58 domain-containing protein [Streptosporangiaceae bacterium]